MPPAFASLSRHLAPPLAALLLCAVLQDGVTALRYWRPAIEQGEWWRLLSGNLVHLGWSHLLLNGLGLLLVWSLLGRAYGWRHWGWISLAAALTVSGGLYWGSPAVQWYVGLSGVLHGLLVAGAIGMWHRERCLAALLLLGLSAKLVWEQMQGSLPGTTALAGGAVIVDAHLYGAIGGAWAAVAVRLLQRAGRSK